MKFFISNDNGSTIQLFETSEDDVTKTVVKLRKALKDLKDVRAIALIEVKQSEGVKIND